MRTVIALLLLTATAHAGNNELSMTSSTRALRTSSANAITEGGLVSGGLTYGRRLAVLPRLELWTQAAYAFGSADGTMFKTLATDLDTFTLTVGGQLRYELHHRIIASARLDIGTMRAELAIRDGAGHSASDHGWGAITSAAAGADCYIFRGQRYAFGLRAELGIVATSSIPLTSIPDSDRDGTLQLEMTAASLGSLDLSGPAFAASIVGQF